MKTWFEVWALCYDKDGMAIAGEEFLGEFATKEEAIEHADKYKDISYVYTPNEITYLADDDYMEIHVEEVQANDFGTEAVETIYERPIYRPTR